MTEMKKHRSGTKMVPVPSQSIVPERDVNKLPVLELKFAPVKTQKLRLEITRVEHPWKRLMHEWEVYEK